MQNLSTEQRHYHLRHRIHREHITQTKAKDAHKIQIELKFNKQTVIESNIANAGSKLKLKIKIKIEVRHAR